MSSRVRYAIVVEPLDGTHLSYLPPSNAACPSFQPCGRSWMNCRPRSSASGRNGRMSFVPSDWYQTGLAVLPGHDRMRVAEAPDASERAEVVVEGPVLLHQDDDVLDVLDAPGTVVRRERGGPLDAVRQCREGRGGTRELEKATPIDFGHG
jgi:hypothetical protein